jgi:hypothetical protein
MESLAQIEAVSSAILDAWENSESTYDASVSAAKNVGLDLNDRATVLMLENLRFQIIMSVT